MAALRQTTSGAGTEPTTGRTRASVLLVRQAPSPVAPDQRRRRRDAWCRALADSLERPALCALCAATLAISTGLAAPVNVPLTVTEVLGQARHETVTSGIPLPKGVLKDPAQVRLVDRAGQALPLGATSLSRWPDGSVKWLLIHCPADVPANATLAWTLVLGEAPAAAAARVTVADTAEGLTVSTGPLQFRIGKAGFRFLEQVWTDANRDGRFEDSEALLRPGAGGSWMEFEHASPHAPQEENWLWDASGGPRERFTAAPDATGYTVTVEESGPARAVVAVRGTYRNDAGRKVAPFWVRYTANAGEAKIGVEHFFAFDGDPKTDFLRTLALRLPLRVTAPLAATFGTQGTSVFAVPADVGQVLRVHTWRAEVAPPRPRAGRIRPATRRRSRSAPGWRSRSWRSGRGWPRR